jgi:hypothetical protein
MRRRLAGSEGSFGRAEGASTDWISLPVLIGLRFAWCDRLFEAIRNVGVLFLFPVMYYFTHPEPYHLRTVDPLIVILSACTILRLRALDRLSADHAASSEAMGEEAG